jgi:flagellar hook-basal body complex protein FliE
MTVLPIGAVAGEWSISHIGKLGAGEQSAGVPGGLAGSSGTQGAASSSSLGGLEGTSGVEGVSGAEGASGAEATSGATGAESGGFGNELTNAISSLEQTQNNASSASQALATGTVKDPEAAVATVEEAQLAMQLASQLRTKATEATQQIFQTQV